MSSEALPFGGDATVAGSEMEQDGGHTHETGVYFYVIGQKSV